MTEIQAKEVMKKALELLTTHTMCKSTDLLINIASYVNLETNHNKDWFVEIRLL